MEFFTLPPFLSSDSFWAYVFPKLDIYTLVQLRSCHPYFLHSIKNPEGIIIERVTKRLKYLLGGTFDYLLEHVDLEISGELLYECIIDRYTCQTVDFLMIRSITNENEIFIGTTVLESDIVRKKGLPFSQTNYLIQDRNIVSFREYNASNLKIRIIYCNLDKSNFSLVKGLELTKFVGICKINKNNENKLTIKNLELKSESIFNPNDFKKTGCSHISIKGHPVCIIS